MGIFDKRIALKPYEYPEVMGYIDAINHSFWTKGEWKFTADIHEYHTDLTAVERTIIKKAMLAISQIEVSVKSFWGKLGDRFPKPEFQAVGFTFAESEVRHERAYSSLLEVLGLNDDFDGLLEIPAIQDRVDYLTKYLRGAADNSNQNYTLSLALFSLFIENVSLFSQFAIIKAFNKERNVLKDIDNVIQATMKEETLHALLGIYIINKIKEENPTWFNEDFYRVIDRACHKALAAEVKILDWIFEEGELRFLPKATVVEFIKQRFNDSIVAIGGQAPFELDEELLGGLLWLNEEIDLQVHVDFFHKKSPNYSKKNQAVTANDLF